MRKIFIPLVLSILIFALIGAYQDRKQPEFVEGELIIKWKSEITAEAIPDILSATGAQVVKEFPGVGVQVVKLPETLSVEKAVKEFKARGEIAFAEPNYIVHTFGVPNDPDFSKCWGLNNTGQTGGKADADIDAPEAWDVQTGSDTVLIGIVDTGIDISHPDLANNIYTNPGEDAWTNPNDPRTGNGKDDDGNGKIDDWKGWNFISETNDARDDNVHGTHVAGTIGAVGNNGNGVVGVNWQTRLVPLKFLSASGSGTTSDAIEAIIYAADMGVKILNNSWGGGGESQALRDAISYAGNKGVLFVVAAGNDGVNIDIDPTYPASYDLPNILCVAASDHNDERALWNSTNGGNGGCGLDCGGNGGSTPPGSNYGATAVDLAAPGKNIYSTVPDGYDTLSGTSMATPHVAGLAGLVWAKFPNLTHVQVKQRLMDTVDALPSFAGKTVTGGRINARAALTNP